MATAPIDPASLGINPGSIGTASAGLSSIVPNPAAGNNPAVPANVQAPQPVRSDIGTIIQQVQAKYPQIPAGLIPAMVQVESGGNPQAVSRAGAMGVAQIMPSTAQRYGINPRDPVSAIDGMARILLDNYHQLGDWTKAITAYDAGVGGVQSGHWAKVPESAQYAGKVLGAMRQLGASGATGAQTNDPFVVQSGAQIAPSTLNAALSGAYANGQLGNTVANPYGPNGQGGQAQPAGQPGNGMADGTFKSGQPSWNQAKAIMQQRGMTPEQIEGARQLYFRDVVAPNYNPSELPSIKQKFDADTTADPTLLQRASGAGASLLQGAMGMDQLPVAAARWIGNTVDPNFDKDNMVGRGLLAASNWLQKGIDAAQQMKPQQIQELEAQNVIAKDAQGNWHFNPSGLGFTKLMDTMAQAAPQMLPMLAGGGALAAAGRAAELPEFAANYLGYGLGNAGTFGAQTFESTQREYAQQLAAQKNEDGTPKYTAQQIQQMATDAAVKSGAETAGLTAATGGLGDALAIGTTGSIARRALLGGAKAVPFGAVDMGGQRAIQNVNEGKPAVTPETAEAGIIGAVTSAPMAGGMAAYKGYVDAKAAKAAAGGVPGSEQVNAPLNADDVIGADPGASQPHAEAQPGVNYQEAALNKFKDIALSSPTATRSTDFQTHLSEETKLDGVVQDLKARQANGETLSRDDIDTALKSSSIPAFDDPGARQTAGDWLHHALNGGERPAPEFHVGNETSAHTPSGLKIDGQYAVVEAAALTTSHDAAMRENPLYPTERQPRDRTRATSAQWVHETSNKIVPEWLGESAKVSDGAPWVDKTGVVDSGNGRTLALTRAYVNGKADAYRQHLIDHADDFGINPDQVAQMHQPVLVRVRQTDVDPVGFAREANESDVAQMSATETAQSDAEKMPSLDTFHVSENGAIDHQANDGWIRAFVNQVVPKSEMGGMYGPNGRLSKTGLQRVQNAVLAKAYGNSDMISRILESTDNNIRNITNGLLRAAPAVAKMREDIKDGAAHDVDITHDLINAVEQYARLKDSGISLEKFLAQSELLEHPYSSSVRSILKFLDENSRSSKRIGEFISNYAQALKETGLPGNDLFGERPQPSKAALINKAQQGVEPDGQERSDVDNAVESGTSSVEKPADGNPAENPRGGEGESAGTGETGRQVAGESEAGGATERAPQPEEVIAGREAFEEAAHAAATSPHNELPLPTEAQKEAGNYQKGHVSFHGLDISIENPKGSVRSGAGRDGTPWAVKMQHHYGYIKGTIGRDKDHLDIFIGPDHASDKVYVVDQVDPATDAFDEHKIMAGFPDEAAAREGYLSNYMKGWKGLGAITEMDMPAFKEWLKSDDTQQPLSKDIPVEAVKTDKAGLEGDRRQDLSRRKRIEEMTPEELRREIMTDPLTGLGNRRAYEDSDKLPYQASVDADGLKWVNDNLGHESGDELLRLIGQALGEETEHAYHISGDEYVVQHDNKDELQSILERASKRLDGASIRVGFPDGSTIEKKGLGFSYGIGRDLTEAESGLREHKSQREQQGIRAPRGGEPAGVVRTPAEGRQDHLGNAAAEGTEGQVAPSADAGAPLAEHPISYAIKPLEDGGESLSIHSPEGMIGGTIAHGALRLDRSEIPETASQDTIRALHRQALEIARERGLKFESNVTVPPREAKAYEDLAGEGFPVEKHLAAQQLEDGAHYVSGGKLEEPVYRMANEANADTPDEGLRSHRQFRHPNGNGMEVDQVRSIVEPIRARWKNAPDIEVVQSVWKLPREYALQIIRKGAEHDTQGFLATRSGKVYLIADNLNEKTARTVLLHEALGHYGLRGVFGDKLDNVLRMVYAARKGEAKVIAGKYDIDLTTEDGRLEAAEEVLAYMAQENKPSMFLDRAVAVVRDWMRRVMPDLKVSDAEIRDVIARARRHVEEGPDSTGRTVNTTGELHETAAPASRGGRNSSATDEMARLKARLSRRTDGSEIGDFGPIFRSYWHDAKGAIAKLKELKDGEVVGALHRPEIGDIDLVWGKIGDKGYGLAHIAEKRGEAFLDKIPDIVQSGIVIRKPGIKDRIYIETPDHTAVVRLDWNGQAKRWLVTTFEKSPHRNPDGTSDVAGNQGDATELPASRGEADINIANNQVADKDSVTTPAAPDAPSQEKGPPLKRPERSTDNRIESIDSAIDEVNTREGAPAAIGERIGAADGTEPGSLPGQEAGKVADDKEAVNANDIYAQHPSGIQDEVGAATTQNVAEKPAAGNPKPSIKDGLKQIEERIRKGNGDDEPIRSLRKHDDVTKTLENLRKKTRSGPIDTILRKAGGEILARKITQPAYDWLLRHVGELVPEKIKAGVIDRYGVPDDAVDRSKMTYVAMQKAARETATYIEKLAVLDRAQSRIAYEWMQTANDPAHEAHLLEQLPEESRKVLLQVKDLIDKMGKEAVRLKQLSPEAYERNKMAYLHRMYAEHELEMEGLEKGKRDTIRQVLADQYKGRGMTKEVGMKQVAAADPDFWERKLVNGKADKSLKGKKLIMLERHANATGTDNLPGVEGQKGPGRVLERIYFPADKPLPARYEAWHNQGTWEVRDVKGDKLVLWRDFTKEERQRMGELDEVKYAVARTLHMMSQSIETGRYFEWLGQNYAEKSADDIPEGHKLLAKDETWLNSLKNTFGKNEWVQVPESRAPGTDTYKYGNLAGRYVPGPIWNDMRAIIRRSPITWDWYNSFLRFWKGAKTALSPTVHINNTMANFFMADFHDVGARDILQALQTAIKAKKGDQEAQAIIARFEDSGATHGMFTVHDLRRETIEPLEKALRDELGRTLDQQSALVKASMVMSLLKDGAFREAFGAAKTLAGQNRAVNLTKKGMTQMEDLYNFEDSVFRLAMFHKGVREGQSDFDAGKAARTAFHDYDIHAPWINGMRQTAFPFLAFPYRMIPMLARTLAEKPWKPLKWMMVAGGLNALAYAWLGYGFGGGQQQEKERALLPDEKAGKIWGIIPKLMRLPWNDENGNAEFLDIRRFIPLGDFIDIGEMHTALPISPALMIGGPLSMAAEFFSNKSFFTGKDITNETMTLPEKIEAYSKYLWQSIMPNIALLPGSYAWNSVADAIHGKTDAFGREQSLPESIANTVGFKVGSYPQDIMLQNQYYDWKRKDMELRREQRSVMRQYAQHGISQDEMDKELQDIGQKRQNYGLEFAEKVKKAQ